MTQESPVAVQEKTNILVVDDLHEKHVVFRTILDELGHNIVSAHSGKEALRCILEMEFAVILLDVNMPDIDGLETASLIHQYKKSAQTPIIFITAYMDDVQAKQGYAVGAVDYIPSPVVPEMLRSKVRVFVELFRMNRQLQVQAVERERLARSEAARAAAEAAIHRADYLAEASQLLSRSLDVQATIKALFEVAVPVLAERAVLALADTEGRSTLVETCPHRSGGHRLAGPLLEAVQRGLKERKFELRRDAQEGVAICPLLAGGRVLGVLVLLGPRANFDPARVALVKEVASRASIAMENARLYAEVREADRRKNEFLAMLAHELRNPLAPIRNAVHIMRGAGVGQSTMNWAHDVISRQTDHMVRLVDDLLDVSRIVQGKVMVKPEILSLAALIERSVEASAPRVTACGQVVNVKMPNESVMLNGDAVRLSQVLSNLINNASKFSAPNAAITLAASYADGEARISVKDQGTGIDPAFLPHIFDLFAQADQSLDRSQGGLGIGLTLVKHLVELHGGRVTAHSEGVGRGTEVTVALPAQPAVTTAPAPVVALTRETPTPVAKPMTRILVVDDLAASAETLMMLLEMEGFEVMSASDGVAALKIAVDFRPDAVLLDIGLPGMNGFEIARRLRNQPESQEALLIAVTGYGEAESRNRSAQSGFDFHMTKPADLHLLLSMLADPQEARKANAKALT